MRFTLISTATLAALALTACVAAPPPQRTVIVNPPPPPVPQQTVVTTTSSQPLMPNQMVITRQPGQTIIIPPDGQAYSCPGSLTSC